MKLSQRLTILDAVFAQRDAEFDCISIMNFIRENEINGRTINHHDIAIYLENMLQKGFIEVVKRAEFTKYKVVIP